MPTYEYRCERCEFRQDRFLPISRAKDVEDCPDCGGRRTFRKCVGVPQAMVDNFEPYHEWQLPLKPGESLGRPNVFSKAQLLDRCKEQGLERNQGYSKDFVPGD